MSITAVLVSDLFLLIHFIYLLIQHSISVLELPQACTGAKLRRFESWHHHGLVLDLGQETSLSCLSSLICEMQVEKEQPRQVTESIKVK